MKNAKTAFNWYYNIAYTNVYSKRLSVYIVPWQKKVNYIFLSKIMYCCTWNPLFEPVEKQA